MRIFKFCLLLIFIAFCTYFWDKRRLADNIVELFNKENKRIEENIKELKK